MHRDEILLKISTAVAKVVEHQNFELSDETTANDVDGWESITHMMIVSEIENVFDIKFQLMDLMNMNNVGDLVTIIEEGNN